MPETLQTSPDTTPATPEKDYLNVEHWVRGTRLEEKGILGTIKDELELPSLGVRESVKTLLEAGTWTASVMTGVVR